MSTQPTFWRELADLPHALEYRQIGPWRTRVLTVGDGDGDGDETVVLLNGTTGHIEAFTKNVRALASRYRVVGYDYPGQGYTTLTDHDLEIPEYEAHLLALLDDLGIASAHLIGESLGGWIAIKFAQHHPERVRSLVLSAPGGRVIADGAMARTRPVSSRAVEDPTFEHVKERLAIVIHDPALITDELVEVRRAIYSRPGFAATLPHLLALQQPETRARHQVTEADYAALPVPTLLVWTDHEPSGGVDLGRRLAEAIPDGELLVIRDAAHWPQWEDSATFDARALDFLGRQA